MVGSWVKCYLDISFRPTRTHGACYVSFSVACCQSNPHPHHHFQIFFWRTTSQWQCVFIDNSIASSPEMAGNGHMCIILIAVLSANPTTCPPLFFFLFTCIPLLPLRCMCAVSSCPIPFLSLSDHSPGEMCGPTHHEVGPTQGGNKAVTSLGVKSRDSVSLDLVLFNMPSKEDGWEMVREAGHEMHLTARLEGLSFPVGWQSHMGTWDLCICMRLRQLHGADDCEDCRLWGCAWRSEPCGDRKGPQFFGLSILPAVKLTDKPEFCTWLAQQRKPSHCHERRNDNSFKTKCFTAIASSIPIACNKEEMQASLLMFYFYGPALFASDFHQFL